MRTAYYRIEQPILSDSAIKLILFVFFNFISIAPGEGNLCEQIGLIFF